jgi:hypothetical protein
MPQDVYDPEADQENSKFTDSQSPTNNNTGSGGFSYNNKGDDLDDVRNGEENGGRVGDADNQAGESEGGATSSTSGGEGGATSRTGSGGGTTSTGGNNVPSSGQLEQSEAGAGDDSSLNFNAKGDKSGLLQRGKSRIRGLAKNKLFVFAAASFSGLILAVIAILILFIGLLKIPDLAQNITAYQFNRVTQDYADSAQEEVSEDLAIQAADGGLGATLKAQYQNLRDNTWGRLDNLRPAIIMDNLAANNNLKLHYQPGGIFGQELKGITLNNETYLVKDVTGPWKYIPGVSSVLDLQNQIEFSNNFFPALNSNMQLDGVGPIIRGVTENRLRQEAGISLTAWVVSKFQGDSPTQAELEQAREAYAAIDQEQQASRIPTTEDLRDAVNTVDQETTADVASDSKLLQILNNGGVDPAVSTTLQNAFSSSVVTKALGALNPVVGVGLPLCIIYDGSLENSGPTIDEQTTEEQRSYYYISSAADQEKYGETTGEAVGALNNQMGDITQANAEVRANGGIVDTSNTLSAEASADGQYTVLDALLGSSVAGPLDASANILCPVISDTGAVIGLTIIQLVAALATGGVSEGAEEGAGVAAESALGTFAQNMLSRFATQGAGKVGGKIGDIVSDTVGTGAKIAGATIAAKLVVLSDSSTLHDGLEEGTDLTNEADAGGNFTANQLEQQMFYGRPLTACEASQGDEASQAQLAEKVESESTYNRYADIMNPNSLANKLSVDVSGLTKPSIVSSLVSFGDALLEPVKSLSGMFATLSPSTAFAATGCGNDDSSDYGNVQFGWPQSEENLIRSNPTYGLLVNQEILDKASNTAEVSAIASTYGKCFTDTVGTLLSGSDNGGKPEIVRDQNGNVLDKGLCSPTNLGPNNPKYGDFVFRWRLANRYSNVLDQLEDEQTNNDSTEQTTSTASSAAPI